MTQAVAKARAPKVILLSGPPRSGKDTAGKLLNEALGGTLEKFSGPMKYALPELIGIPFSVLESTKDQALDALELPSFRQLQIDMSERYMKPLYGDDIFARLLLYRMGVACDDLFIITDCGFQIEVNTVADAIGPENCLLINMYRSGCTYKGDSRSPVHPFKWMNVVNISNNCSLELLEKYLIYAANLLWQLDTSADSSSDLTKEHASTQDNSEVYAPMRG